MYVHAMELNYCSEFGTVLHTAGHYQFR